MKILLIDDHISFCEGLIAAISTTRDDYQVDFESDAELIPQSLLGNTDYDLFIMDLMMPGLGGIELLKYLNTKKNQTPVMVMSSVQDIAVIRQVFNLGIIGYLPKSYSVYQIVDAIEQCRGGDIHIPSFLASSVESSPGPDSKSDTGSETGQHLLPVEVGTDARQQPDSGIRLTKRQIEIVSLMDNGLSNQEIADKLYISKATVKTHVNSLFKTFEVNNRISCLRAAKKAGVMIAS